MRDLAPVIRSMKPATIDKVRQLEMASIEHPQVFIETSHVLHAGMYARTVRIPAGVIITGALIKVATTLIVSGDAIMYGDDGPVKLDGYNVISAFPYRKMALVAVTDTHLTMLFPTNAKTVEEAENEFTDETDMLMSRKDGQSCLA